VENQQVLSRVRQFAFEDPKQTLVHVHVLDIAKDGYIKPHIDSIRVGTQTLFFWFKSVFLLVLWHDDCWPLVSLVECDEIDS
jgi:hypothetical protein